MWLDLSSVFVPKGDSFLFSLSKVLPVHFGDRRSPDVGSRS